MTKESIKTKVCPGEFNYSSEASTLKVQPHVRLSEPGELLNPQKVINPTIFRACKAFQAGFADNRSIFQSCFCFFN